MVKGRRQQTPYHACIIMRMHWSSWPGQCRTVTRYPASLTASTAPEYLWRSWRRTVDGDSRERTCWWGWASTAPGSWSLQCGVPVLWAFLTNDALPRQYLEYLMSRNPGPCVQSSVELSAEHRDQLFTLLPPAWNTTEYQLLSLSSDTDSSTNMSTYQVLLVRQSSMCLNILEFKGYTLVPRPRNLTEVGSGDSSGDSEGPFSTESVSTQTLDVLSYLYPENTYSLLDVPGRTFLCPDFLAHRFFRVWCVCKVAVAAAAGGHDNRRHHAQERARYWLCSPHQQHVELHYQEHCSHRGAAERWSVHGLPAVEEVKVCCAVAGLWPVCVGRGSGWSACSVLAAIAMAICLYIRVSCGVSCMKSCNSCSQKPLAELCLQSQWKLGHCMYYYSTPLN